MSHPNYIGAGTAAEHATAGLILDLHAAMATGTGPNNNTATGKATWTDLSGNGYNATLTNVGYTEDSGWHTNPDCVALDGVNDYILVTPSLSIPHECTIEIWTQALRPTTTNAQLLAYRSGDVNNDLFTSYQQNNRFSAGVYKYDWTQGVSVWPPDAPTSDDFDQVLIMCNGTELCMSQNNGSEMWKLDPNSKPFGRANSGFMIGSNGSSEPYQGRIAIVRIYNRVLSYQEREINRLVGVQWSIPELKRKFGIRGYSHV